jgi:hypothetical protein
LLSRRHLGTAATGRIERVRPLAGYPRANATPSTGRVPSFKPMSVTSVVPEDETRSAIDRIDNPHPRAAAGAMLVFIAVARSRSQMLLRSQRKFHHPFQELVRGQPDEVTQDELLGVKTH